MSQTIKVLEMLAEQAVKGFDRIRLEVSYDKGRGYSMMAFPAKVEEPGVMTIGLFTGSSSFLEGASRFSANRLRSLANTVLYSEAALALVQQNAQKNGMTLKGDPIYLL